MADEEKAPEEVSFVNGVIQEIINSPLNLVLIAIITFLIFKIFKSRQPPKPSPPSEPELPKLRRDFTVAELKAYDGNQPDGRVLVAVNGTVYDVTRGKRFYGPGKFYMLQWSCALFSRFQVSCCSLKKNLFPPHFNLYHCCQSPSPSTNLLLTSHLMTFQTISFEILYNFPYRFLILFSFNLHSLCFTMRVQLAHPLFVLVEKVGMKLKSFETKFEKLSEWIRIMAPNSGAGINLATVAPDLDDFSSIARLNRFIAILEKQVSLFLSLQSLFKQQLWVCVFDDDNS